MQKRKEDIPSMAQTTPGTSFGPVSVTAALLVIHAFKR